MPPQHYKDPQAGATGRLTRLWASPVVLLYACTRSFENVVETFKLRLPSVRRTMRQASKKLLASKDQAEQMAGAYIHGLLFKTGDHALSRPSAERHAHLYLTDSPCLGRFHLPFPPRHWTVPLREIFYDYSL
jgi:hypothetical protein